MDIMSPEKVFWSLLHVETKTQIDSLTYPQVSLLVSTFNENEYVNWACWHEGSDEWQALEEMLSVLQVASKHAANAPKPPPFTGVTHTGHTNTGHHMAPVTSPKIEALVTEPMPSTTGVRAPEPGTDARLSKRFSKKYKAFIQGRGKTLESHTVDVSLTGLQIRDGLPAGNDGPLEVTLVNSKGESLQLICSLIPDEKRTRMKIVRAGKLDQFHSWLLDPSE